MASSRAKSETPPRTFKARYRKGAFEPLDRIDLPEGQEVTLAVLAPPAPSATDWLTTTAGSWRNLLDTEQLKQDIADSRARPMRAEPRL